VGGIVVMYAIGIPVLASKSNLSLLDAATACLIFIPGDLLKAVVAGLVTEAAFRAAPQAFAGR
jgi:biotin transport system substrate-specific component